MNDASDHSMDRRRGAERADSFLRLIERARRGKLKVYLGYGPGVGKTYRMLQEAHALKAQGVDVVVGYVEDHGRAETQALVEGLEIMPRRTEDYRGVSLEEMDIDAVLQRAPTVALVDELAHTNAPGSRHKKRYEDVMGLLDEGIHVVTTLNVQHLESLYDTVERLVGVKVKERLPDWVLEEADQVVNVDLSTEDLHARMEAGQIYPPERIRASLGNFFRRENLEHLRNLTLREIAAHIERKSRALPDVQPVSVPDQVMVCLSSRGPDSPALLRYGSRLAGRLNRNWYALYVQTPAEEATRIDARTQRLLSGTLALAHRLGATVMTYKGTDVAETILRFAAEYGVGHIVIGRPPPRSWWQRLLGRPGLVARLIDQAADRTVVVVDTQASHREASAMVVPAARPEPTPAASAPALPVSAYLTEDRIVIWHEPLARRQVLKDLLRRALREAPEVPFDEALARLQTREAEGSTFLDEGIAMPHLRLEGLARPAFALGLPRVGIPDVPARQSIEMVWLYLLPENGSTPFMPSAQLSRMFRTQYLREKLAAAEYPVEVLRAIHDWEHRHLDVL